MSKEGSVWDALITAVTKNGEETTVEEISNATGLPESSVERVILSFLRRGLIEMDDRYITRLNYTDRK